MSVRRRLGSLAETPQLDRWIRFERDGTVLIRSGKAELGQGLRTALTAIAADELSVSPSRIRVQGASTGESPDEGNTGGSRSIEQSGAAVRQACAHARRLLVARAADRLGCPYYRLSIDDGVIAGDGKTTTYWEVLDGGGFDVEVREPVDPVPADTRRYVGHGLPRVDLPAKVRGDPVFVPDLVLAGMRHARVVRPPRLGARLVAIGATTDDVDVDVVRRGSFLAVVADRAGDAIAAAAALARVAQWEGGVVVEPACDGPDHLEAHVRSSTLIVDGTSADDPPGDRLDHAGAVRVAARYSKPFLMHGSIGPSAAVAHLDDGRLIVWSHSQNVEALRRCLAEVLDLDEGAVRVRHVDGAGCYGHNGADDAALDAAVVAVAHAGTPISVVWSRADEHGFEPLGPAMSIRLDAGIDATGSICSWQHELFSASHMARPRPAGREMSGLLAAWDLDRPIARPVAKHGRGNHSGAHRNADPLYAVGTRRVVSHLVDGTMPRTSALRALGAFANVFAIESFMDELADAIGADAVAFRLRHLVDPRARAVIEAAVEMAGGMAAAGGIDAPGRGLGFARYKNSKAYVAVVAEVEVVAHTGEVRLSQAWIAADAGEVVDPDGLVNQLEGGFVQAASWTLKERVGFDAAGVATRDWESYPILLFSEVPEIATRLLDHPSEPSLGAGEAIAGPAAAAIANAVFQATGARVRDLPLRPDRVMRTLNELLTQGDPR